MDTAKNILTDLKRLLAQAYFGSKAVRTFRVLLLDRSVARKYLTSDSKELSSPTMFAIACVGLSLIISSYTRGPEYFEATKAGPNMMIASMFWGFEKTDYYVDLSARIRPCSNDKFIQVASGDQSWFFKSDTIMKEIKDSCLGVTYSELMFLLKSNNSSGKYDLNILELKQTYEATLKLHNNAEKFMQVYSLLSAVLLAALLKTIINVNGSYQGDPGDLVYYFVGLSYVLFSLFRFLINSIGYYDIVFILITSLIFYFILTIRFFRGVIIIPWWKVLIIAPTVFLLPLVSKTIFTALAAETVLILFPFLLEST